MNERLLLKPYEITSIFEELTSIPQNLDLIRAREVWKSAKQGKGKTVAIIDTGVDKEHPNLQKNIIGGYNFTSDNNGDILNFTDYVGHGTHVAGIIGACKCDNHKGIIGVAPKTNMLILKVIDRYGSGSHKQLIDAMNYAMDWKGPKGEKVDVINMSLGGTKPCEELHKVIKQARQRGIVLVSAAGNGGDGNKNTFEVSFPGYYKEVIQVGSVKNTLAPSLFSNTNVNIDFVAPGENVISTHLNKKFVELTGTSMASPHVAGAAALILNLIDQPNRADAPYFVYQYFLKHARKLDYSINQVGNGLIQLTS